MIIQNNFKDLADDIPRGELSAGEIGFLELCNDLWVTRLNRLVGIKHLNLIAVCNFYRIDINNPMVERAFNHADRWLFDGELDFLNDRNKAERLKFQKEIEAALKNLRAARQDPDAIAASARFQAKVDRERDFDRIKNPSAKQSSQTIWDLRPIQLEIILLCQELEKLKQDRTNP
jgi:hypothetical protein